MTDLVKQVLEEQQLSEDKEQTENLQRLYKQVLEAYIAGNYPGGPEGETLMCSIHDAFQDGHNCVGCNLNEQSGLLIRYLAGYPHFKDLQLVSVQFHLHLYLLAERYLTYIELIKLHESQRGRYFSVFQKVIHWANFLKHPKSFVLVHHPSYLIAGLKEEQHDRSDFVVIDDEFVKTYYADGELNGKLRGKLAKKENVMVRFPDPIGLIGEFVKAQQKFVELIKENAVFREILSDEASIKDSFDMERAS
jgi:hypothetical protein